MKHTCIGIVASPDGLAFDRTNPQRRAWASPATEYRSTQPRHIPVDLNHDGVEVGRIVHLEHRSGGIWAVAELDVPEPALIVRVGDQDVALRDPTYFSAMRSADSDDRDLELLSVAICHRTARIGARPLTWFEGDLACRSGWTSDTAVIRPLLNRAAEANITRHGQPIRIHGHTDGPRTRITIGRMLEPTAPIEYRTAQHVDVRTSRRTIELIVMPYERETLVAHQGRMIEEICSPHAFDQVDRQGNKIRVNRDHKVERVIGQAVRFDPRHPDGLLAEVRIANTELGNESLALASEGILDASAGFAPLPGGQQWENRDQRRRLTRCWLDHIALTPSPAYPTANVLAVRAGAG